MLQAKDSDRISEIKNQVDNSEKIADRLLGWLSFFEFKSVYKTLDPLKSKGYLISELIKVLLVVPFAGKNSMYALLRGGKRELSEACKDSYYRLKKMDEIDWEKLLLNFAHRFIRLCKRKGQGGKKGWRCLVVDDTLLPKTGCLMEGISRLWDHVSMRYVLGFRLLVLGYFDGSSFLPVSFSMHREKGKNQSTPYGLKPKEYAAQYHRKRNEQTPAATRVREMDSDKITAAIRMIRQACKVLEVDYLLMDSWFTCEKMLCCAKKLQIKLIGMMKMGNAKYDYQGGQYTASELLRRLKKQHRRCRKLSSRYIEVSVSFKGHPVKLFFSCFSRKGNWQLVLSTDLTTGYLQTMRIYQIRWSIEVFNKEAKQYLAMGKSQAEDASAQFADITISMIQYILLTLRKRFGEYETKGAVFRHAEEHLLTLTLDHRLWGLLLELLLVIVEILDLPINDLDAFMDDLIQKDKVKKVLKVHFSGAA